jgi:hypothetical protein
LPNFSVPRRVAAILACTFLAACAAAPSPTNVTTWRDPGFSGPPFRKIFVVGLSAQSLVDQRGFEDAMVAALQSAGVVAVPGWQFVPTDRVPDEATMRAAVARSGADGALLVRMSDVQTESTLAYSPGTVAQAGPNLYVGWYAPGVVSESYQAATIFTTLFDVATARAVWTYNPPAYSALSLSQDVPAFANDVVGRLQAGGLIATR